MNVVDILHMAREVWEGIGFAVAVTTPVIVGGGVFHVLLSVSRDK